MIKFRLSILALVVAVSCSAATFKTQRLGEIATAVRMDNLVMYPSSDTIFYYNGRALNVRTNILGDISHIGYNLFSAMSRKACGYTDLCDFIERYALELDLRLDGRSPEERMDIDRVVITRGNWQMLLSLPTAQLTNMETIKRRMFRMTWNVDGSELRITIPADCQLLIGADAPELEDIMERDIARMPKSTPPDIPFKEVNISRSDSMEIYGVGSYLSEMIRGDIYYSLSNGERRVYCDSRTPSRSISNIMLTGQFNKPINMCLTVNKYGYRTNTVMVTLAQFITYCVDEGGSLYFGIKSVTDDEVTGTLFVRNDDMGYNHVLSVVFPTAILRGENLPIATTLYAYIPLHNVTEKFFNEE